MVYLHTDSHASVPGGAAKLYLGKKDGLWQRPVRDMALSFRGMA
nr:hypothetical protein [uncultured Acetatifactor sp.]